MNFYIYPVQKSNSIYFSSRIFLCISGEKSLKQQMRFVVGHELTKNNFKFYDEDIKETN